MIPARIASPARVVRSVIRSSTAEHHRAYQHRQFYGDDAERYGAERHRRGHDRPAQRAAATHENPTPKIAASARAWETPYTSEGAKVSPSEDRSCAVDAVEEWAQFGPLDPADRLRVGYRDEEVRRAVPPRRLGRRNGSPDEEV